jgi:hypothetical protein
MWGVVSVAAEESVNDLGIDSPNPRRNTKIIDGIPSISPGKDMFEAPLSD